MPTTDCDCYHELINMKEMFKKKCFGKSNTGLYKHLILGGLTYGLWRLPTCTTSAFIYLKQCSRLNFYKCAALNHPLDHFLKSSIFFSDHA